MARLLRTSQVLDTSERHISTLEETNLDRLEISSYFAQIAAVTFFSEMEEKLRDIVKARFRHGGDDKLGTFLGNINDKQVARMKRREISETVGLFGDQCKVDFQAAFPASDLEAYSNVIRDRHETSHSGGSDVTLAEVRSAMEIGERILDQVEIVIT